MHFRCVQECRLQLCLSGKGVALGWNLSLVVGSRGRLDPAAFGTGPDQTATLALLDALGLPHGDPIEEMSIFDAICSGEESLFAGVYGDGFVLIREGLVDGFFDTAPTGWRRFFASPKPVARHVTALIERSHQQSLLVALLQSSANLWGYAIVANGKPTRCVAGGVLDPVIVDEGGPTAEEAAVRAGRPLGDVTASGDGEEIVFEVAARFLGERLDRAEAFLEAPILQFD